MLKIIPAQTKQEIAAVDVLFREYSAWCKEKFVSTGMLKPDAPELQSFNKEILPGEYRHPNGFLLLAYLDNAPVGCMFMHKLDEQVCELKRFYINPMARGKNLAVEMLNEFCRHARQYGSRRLRISSHHFMDKAIGIYRRYGFYEISNYVKDPLQAGNVQMELDLETHQSKIQQPHK